MIEWLVVPACVVLNRARGDDRWMGKNEEIGKTKGWLPGRPLWYVAPVIGLLAWAVGWAWWEAAWFGLCYLFWGTWSWGHLFLWGRYLPQRPVPPMEALLLRWAGRRPWLAMGFREAFALPLVAVQPWALAYPVLANLARGAGYLVRLERHVLLSEALIGALWGLLIVLLSR